MDNDTKEQFKNIENKKGVKEAEEKDSECFLKYSKLDGRHSPDEISNMLQDIGILNVTCPVCDKTYRKAKWRRNRAGCSECRKEHIVCDECFEDIASKLPYPELPIAQSSDPIPIQSEDSTEEKQNLVTFKDDFEQKVLAYGVDFHDETYDHAYQSGAELSSYLNRPVEILKFPWTVGTDFASFRVAPWHLYMTNARIREKLGTFKLLSATLRIKFMLNGSPFHAGRVLVGMRPTRFTNNTHNILPEATATVTNYLHNGSAVSWTPQKTFYSQRPHILLNPSKNIPMEISWPFMSNLDWINVPDLNDYIRLGYLEIWVLNTLRMANGGTDPVTITAYAWLENVKMTGATDVLPQSGPLLPKAQMGRKKKKKTTPDEFSADGVVSYPASILEGMATKLTDTPVIGKWARATAIGAGAVKNIASLFGFSNPAIIDKQCMMTQNQLGRMCQTSGEDPVVKLSLDPKNELCIDPGTVGLGSDDEMAFMNIAQREGLIYSFPWTTTGDQSDGHLFGTRVSPSVAPLVGISVPGQGATVHEWMTPIKFIAAPFRYWTGSLVYRIQVVCSQMHRGRLGIVYTPDINGLAGATAGYNQAEHFTYILDISNETDISFEVKWSQPMAWATTELRPSFADVVSGNSVSLAGDFNHNGRLDIYVITDLGAPIASSEQIVDVNVYLRAGDTFQVGVPGETLPLAAYSANGVSYDLPTTVPTVEFAPPVVEKLPQAQSDGAYNLGDEEDDPNQTAVHVINGAPPTDNTMGLHVYFGEDVRSIRNMIKRYCAYDSVPKLHLSPNAGTTCSFSLLLRNFPTGRAAGNVPYGSSGLNAVQTNNVWNTYLRYYAQAYVGFRGGLRWKCILHIQSSASHYSARVTRRTLLTRDNALRQYTISQADSLANTHLQLMGGGGAMSLANSAFENTAGTIIQPSVNTNTISYEVPWYHPTRYGEIHSGDLSTTVFPTPYNAMFQSHSIMCKQVTTNNSGGFQNPYLDLYCAAGEDAAFFFFIGAPALFALQPVNPT